MKKGFFGLLGLITMTIFTLASCGSNENPTGKGNWGADEVSRNIDAEKEVIPQEDVTPISYTTVAQGNKIFDRDDIVNQDYAGYGLLVVKNEYGYLGFYSLNHDCWLLERQYIEKVVNYDVVIDENVGYFLKLIYDDILYIYDALGNKVFESTKEANLYNINNLFDVYSISSSYINKKVYLTITDENDFVNYYEYSSNGTLKKINSLPQTQIINETIAEKSPFSKNSKYVDLEKVDLKEFGFDGYYLSKKNELVTVFEKSTNKSLSTFTVPNDSTMVFVGDQLIYQNAYVVSDDATNYSFFEGKNKYIIETYSVDLLTGDKEAIDVSYVIGNVFGPYMDAQGVYSYALIAKRSFENTILKSNEMVIIDSNGKIVSNLNGYEPEDFVRVGSNYYNTSTKVLYDSKLSEIAYLAAINPQLMEKYNCFIGKINQKYGVVNSDGIVTVPFDYQNFYTTYISSGFVFGIKDEQLYRVNITTGEETLLGSVYVKFNNYVYITNDTSDIYKIEFVENNLGSYSADSYSKLNQVNNNLYESNVIRFTKIDKNTLTQSIDSISDRFVNITSKKVANASNYTTIGTNKTTTPILGENIEEAQTIKAGNNLMYITSYSGNYFKFIPTEDGFYNLTKLYKGYNVNLSVQLYNEPENQNDKPTYTNVTVNQETYGNIVRLEKDKTYYFKVSTGYTTHGAVYLDLDLEKGEHIKYPAIHKFTNNQTFDYFEDGTYVELIVKGGGYYKIDAGDNVNYEFISSNLSYIPTGYSQGYNVTNITTINNELYYKFNEFTAYLVKLNTYDSTSKLKFGVSYSNDETLNPIGSSIINPFVLKSGDNNVSFDGINYYKYHCTNDCNLRLSSTNSSIFNGTSSYARIYEGEYNPSITSYSRIYNGNTIEAKANTDYYIRINQSSNTKTPFVLNVEEITQTISQSNSININTTGVKTYYFSPTYSGLYEIKLYAYTGDQLIGYDMYNQKIFEKTAIENGYISYTQYLSNNAVYKFAESTKSNSNFTITQVNSANNQYLIESKNNIVYFNNSNSDTILYFTPRLDGEYSFATTSGGSLSTFNIVDVNNESISSTTYTDDFKYYIVNLKAGIDYKITVRNSNSGNTNIMVSKEYGQHWFSPITLNAMEEYNATEFLKKTGNDTAYLYAKIYFPEQANITFEGFDKYSLTLQNPSYNLSNSQQVSAGSTYYLRATINSLSTKVSTSLTGSFTEGLTIYKPKECISDSISGYTNSTASKFYKITNNTDNTQLVEFDNLINVDYIYAYDENYKMTNISANKIFFIKAKSFMVLKLNNSYSGNYSIELEKTNYSEFGLNNESINLSSDKLITKTVVYPEDTYINIKVESKPLNSTLDDMTINILDSSGNVIAYTNLVNGVASISYVFDKLTKYTIEFAGEGSFDIKYDNNPLIIVGTGFTYDEINKTYTSTNKNTSSTGSMTITADCDLNLNFDLLLSCGSNDRVTITRRRGTTNTTLNTFYGYNYGNREYSQSAQLLKGDVVTITYTRSTYSSYNNNNAVVSNISYSLVDNQ